MAFDVEGARKAGYSDAEIADHLAQQRSFDIKGARAAGYGDSDIVAHLSAAQTKELPKYDKRPDSFGKRLAMGIAEPFVGAVQALKHAAEIPALDYVPVVGAINRAVRATGSASDYDQTAQQLRKAQESGAPEGMDWARVGGNIIGLAPTVVSGGPSTSIASLARTGAQAGGIGGFLMPSDGGENFATDKAIQTGVGAVAGAVAGPLAQRAIQGINAGAGAILNQVRRLGSNVTPQQIQVVINQTLQQAGIDPSQLSQAFMRDVSQQVRRALGAGGSVDERALANRAAFEQVGARGTRGQITQNPSQFSNELYLREAPGGEDLAAQYQNTLATLNQRLGDLQAGAAPPVRNVEAGQRVINVLANADARGNELVNALYGAARNSAGIDTPINGAVFAQNALNRMEQSMVGDRLPSTFTNVLNQLSTGQRELNIRTGEQITRAVNQRIGQTNDRTEQAALRIFKDELQNAIESSGSAAGDAAATAFRTAKGAAAQRFAIHDAIPALRAVVEGNATPDNFMQQFVYKAPLADFRRLGSFVEDASPQAWQQIRGQVLADLQRAANPSGDGAAFSEAGFGRALRTLDQSGKLEVLFTPSEISQLRAIQQVARLTVAGPPGVSRTGLSGAAKATGMLLRMVGAVPGLGRVAGAAESLGQRGGNVLQATAAMQPPPVAQIPMRGLSGETVNALALPFAVVPGLPLAQSMSD